MDVGQHSNYSMSLTSQDEYRKLKTVTAADEVYPQASIYDQTIRRMSQPYRQTVCFDNLQPIPTITRTENSDQQSIFMKKEVAQFLTKKKSLLSREKIKRTESVIRIFFFNSDRYREYDRSEVNQFMKVGKFIHYIVEDYCSFYLGISPQTLDFTTFELKLTDHHNKHDSVIDAIDYNDEISPYFGENLCLIRKVNDTTNIQSYKDTVKQDEEVVQIEYRSKKKTVLKLIVRKNSTIQWLRQRIFKSCDITESVNEYQLIEFNTFKVYENNTQFKDIKERHFELLRSKPKSYDDMYAPNNIMSILQTKDMNSNSQNILTILTEHSITGKCEEKSVLSVEVQRSFMQDKLILQIQNCCLLEKYEKSFMTKVLDFVCQTDVQIKYPLITLVSAYSESECLVLQFVKKEGKVTKRYKINEPQKGLFLNEILRLCRSNKKQLSVPERNST